MFRHGGPGAVTGARNGPHPWNGRQNFENTAHNRRVLGAAVRLD